MFSYYDKAFVCVCGGVCFARLFKLLETTSECRSQKFPYFFLNNLHIPKGKYRKKNTVSKDTVH